MFNVGSGEFLVILVIALVVLGPDRLPEAFRKLGKLSAELRRMSAGFQEELRSALDEPMSQVRGTMEEVRSSLSLDLGPSPVVHPYEAPLDASTPEVGSGDLAAVSDPPTTRDAPEVDDQPDLSDVVITDPADDDEDVSNAAPAAGSEAAANLGGFERSANGHGISADPSPDASADPVPDPSADGSADAAIEQAG